MRQVHGAERLLGKRGERGHLHSKCREEVSNRRPCRERNLYALLTNHLGVSSEEADGDVHHD
jgi:hypothetical protein